MQKVERVRDGLDQAVTKAASMNMENGKDEQGKLSELFFFLGNVHRIFTFSPSKAHEMAIC